MVMRAAALAFVSTVAAQQVPAPSQPPASQPAEAAPVFVEVAGVPAQVWVHEARTFVVRIGCDAAWLQTHAVPLFPQRLSRPFHVTVPWLLGAEDRAVELLPPGSGAATEDVAVGDRVVPLVHAGTERRGERTFDVLELRCRWLPLAPGTSVVAPVQVRYAFATRFVEHVLSGRQPADRQEATVQSAAATLVVRALPPVPPGLAFHGAVGELGVAAHASAATVAVGGAITLHVDVTGAGNLERMAPLPPPRLPGFHVQGVADHPAPGRRRFALDLLALRAGVTAVPSVPFVAFSPSRGDYVELRTEPVPITVTPANAPLPARVQELVDADARAARGPFARQWPWLLALGAVAGALVGRGLRARAARRARLAEARRRLAAAFAAGPAEVLAAFEAALAARAGDATFGAATWARLDAIAGTGAVTTLRELHAAIDHARFGGGLPARDAVLAAAGEAS